MLLDFLEDIFGDLIFKGTERVYNRLCGCSSVRPRLAAAGKVLVFLFLVLGSTAWFALRARIAWAAGEETDMKLYLAFGLMFLVGGIFIGMKHLLRWLKQREERMYDHRYQK